MNFMSSSSFIFLLRKIHPSLPAVQGKIFILAIREELSTFLPWFLSFSLLFCLYTCQLSHCDTEENGKIPCWCNLSFFISGGEAFWQTFDRGTFLSFLVKAVTDTCSCSVCFLQWGAFSPQKEIMTLLQLRAVLLRECPCKHLQELMLYLFHLSPESCSVAYVQK